jgi:hypothetical protein
VWLSWQELVGPNEKPVKRVCYKMPISDPMTSRCKPKLIKAFIGMVVDL